MNLVRRNQRNSLIFFLVIFIALIFIYKSVNIINSYHPVYFVPVLNKINSTTELNNNNSVVFIQRSLEESIKYILQWTSPRNMPFVFMGVGRQNFIDRKCRFTNCYVTSDYSLRGNATMFDAILFAGPEVVRMEAWHLPPDRAPHQKYVFVSVESAGNYPLCSNKFDGFFNWTWTYKLNSDARFGYIVVRDANGKVVGPNKDMRWIKKEDMKPVSKNLKKILHGKRKAAAWFVSNCDSRSGREMIAANLRTRLKDHYGLQLDIYGDCGFLKCPKNSKKCDEMLKTDYLFYLSFENAQSDDYVTEKVITALANYVVPIVFGGANYSRFLPDGSYLYATALDIEKIAAKINESVYDIELYSEYFRWTSHYSFHRTESSPDTDEYCGFCALLNDDAKVKQTTMYTNFHKWWDSYKDGSVCDY